jgi:hypothetical protein
MDAVFTLPYSEFAVTELFISTFKGKDGRFASEWVADLRRNGRPIWLGILTQVSG